MKARFNGKCVECGGEIKTGKQILKNSKNHQNSFGKNQVKF